MSDQYWLTKAQLKRMKPFSRGRVAFRAHPEQSKAPVARNVLQDFVSTAPQGREHVRKAKKDWRRISMPYDRCGYTFFSAVCIAATVIFWLGQ